MFPQPCPVAKDAAGRGGWHPLTSRKHWWRLRVCRTSQPRPRGWEWAGPGFCPQAASVLWLPGREVVIVCVQWFLSISWAHTHSSSPVPWPGCQAATAASCSALQAP